MRGRPDHRRGVVPCSCAMRRTTVLRRALLALLAAALLAGACTSDDGGEEGSGDDEAGFVDAGALAERQDEYLTFATEELDPGSPLNVLAHATRAEDDPEFTWDAEAVTPDAFAEQFAEIEAWEDTTDFDVLYFLNLLYGARDQLPAETVAAIEEQLTGFEYWYTEPTPADVVDDKYYWSENHRIIFHTDEYLAGQALPEATFQDGRTGAEHQEEARERILTWLDEKVRFGFTEWHSDVYYQKDVTPLLSLVEWADDEEVAARAEMVLDLVLFDLAAHLQEGNFGATHGRSYMKDKSRAADQDTFGLAKLLFDDTDQPYTSTGDPGAVLFARAEQYRLPAAIAAVAASDETSVDVQQMGVELDVDAPVTDDPPHPEGYAFDDPEAVPFWWERGAQTAWQVVPQTIDTLDEHDLWESEFFAPFQPLASTVGDDDDAARALAQSLSETLGFGLLTEVDTYTYRSPDVMLSTAQDHRPGVFSDQQQSWQATLDEDAIVFTTHPKDEPEVGTEWPDGDGWWTGTGSTPRSAQQGAAAIHLYAPQFEPGPPLDLGYLDVTHAYFPTERFDEVVQDDGWTFGRRGDGYVGLWSAQPTEWVPHGEDVDGVYTGELTEDFDLVAEGTQNAWVVQVGDADTSGSFEDFRAALVGSVEAEEVAGETEAGFPAGFAVTFTSPTEGELAFAWEGPLTVDGEEVELHPGVRYDNPWVQAGLDDRRYEIEADGNTLVLDFDAGTRQVG